MTAGPPDDGCRAGCSSWSCRCCSPRLLVGGVSIAVRSSSDDGGGRGHRPGPAAELPAVVDAADAAAHDDRTPGDARRGSTATITAAYATLDGRRRVRRRVRPPARRRGRAARAHARGDPGPALTDGRRRVRATTTTGDADIVFALQMARGDGAGARPGRRRRATRRSPCCRSRCRTSSASTPSPSSSRTGDLTALAATHRRHRVGRVRRHRRPDRGRRGRGRQLDRVPRSASACRRRQRLRDPVRRRLPTGPARCS